MRVKACIFDLDGTIIYTLKAIAEKGGRLHAGERGGG